MNTLIDHNNKNAITGSDNETERMMNDFADAGEAVMDLQDSVQFTTYLEKNNIPFNDLEPDYWQAVETVANRVAASGMLGLDKEQTDLFKLVAGLPNALHKEFALDYDAQEYKQTRRHAYDRQESDSFKTVVSKNNTRIRDYAAAHASIPFDTLTGLVTLAANRGVAEAYHAESGELMASTMHGIRTELGFEQKLVAAGLEFRRGTTAEDKLGIDYVVDGVNIDVKSSLLKVNEIAPVGKDTAFAISRGKAIYYPYDSSSDYVENSFVISDEAAKAKAPIIAKDIAAMRKLL